MKQLIDLDSINNETDCKRGVPVLITVVMILFGVCLFSIVLLN